MYPWDEASIFNSSFQMRELIWLSIFSLVTNLEVLVFQIFMYFSWSLPPPVAKRPLLQGHQSKAFTAPLCPLNWFIFPYFKSQIIALPSPDPEAKIFSFVFLVFNEQIWPLWPWKIFTTGLYSLRSCTIIEVSFDPLINKSSIKVKADVLSLWL